MRGPCRQTKVAAFRAFRVFRFLGRWAGRAHNRKTRNTRRATRDVLPQRGRNQKLNQQCKRGCVTCRPTGPLRFLSASQAFENSLKRAATACAANASQTQKQAWESTSHSRRHLETQAAPPPDHPSTMGHNGPDHPNAPRQSDVEVPPPPPPPPARVNKLERGLASIGGPSAGLGREASAIQTQALRRTSTSREITIPGMRFRWFAKRTTAHRTR